MKKSGPLKSYGKFRGCPDHKICYIEIKKGKTRYSRDLWKDNMFVVFDFNKKGQLLGIEFPFGLGKEKS